MSVKLTTYDKWASHFPILSAIVLWAYVHRKDTGFRVLELGAGWYSTPMLHYMLCDLPATRLVTCESNREWLVQFQRLASRQHAIVTVSDWAGLPYCDEPWDVVFVDHAPAKQRKFELSRLLRARDQSTFIVCHDTEPQVEGSYRWAETLGRFRYRRDYKLMRPWTTILSNVREIPIAAV